MSNTMIYLIAASVLGVIAFLETVILILLAKKTHAILELRAWMQKKPLALFFTDSGYVDWKPVKVETNIIEDKEYGHCIIDKGYVDRLTNNMIVCYDADFAISLNMKAAKIAEDLKDVIATKEKLKLFKKGIIRNEITADEESINTLKTSVNLNVLKEYMTNIGPHAISEKIHKAVAQRSGMLGQVNTQQVLIMFAGILGAIIMGYILIKSVA